MDLADLGILVLGIVLGYVIGEALEDIGKRAATMTGTVIVAVLNFSATLLKNTPRFLPILGWGIFLGLVVSIIVEQNEQ